MIPLEARVYAELQDDGPHGGSLAGRYRPVVRSSGREHRAMSDESGDLGA
jgi:hypothetical protein